MRTTTRDDTRRAMLTQCQARLDQARAAESELDALPRWRWLARCSDARLTRTSTPPLAGWNTTTQSSADTVKAQKMNIKMIETTRRCARSHSGSHKLDAMSKHGRHYECRGCKKVYSWREAVDAKAKFPSVMTGVELAQEN